MTSAYHSHHASMKSFLGNSLLNDLDSKHMMTRETSSSMPFKSFCDIVYPLGTKHFSKDCTSDLIGELLADCMDRPSAKMEIYLLLKFLIPKYDHLSVYGFKTTRLIKLLSVVLNKQGRTDDAASLANWLKSPPSQESLLKSEGVVSLPELKIATVMSGKMVKNTTYNLTLQDIGIFCKKLTEGYICVSHDELDSFQVEAWLEIAPYLGFEEWICLVRIVLKKIPMGIGISTFLNEIPYIQAHEFFKRQFNLEKLALNVFLHCQDPASMWKKQMPHLVCGTPFIPMTCHSLKSPYLFQWMFSSEENTEGKFIAPKDGRLLIASTNNGWYIPMSHNAKQKTFVSILEKNAKQNRSRHEHIKLLLEMKRRKLLKCECCYGLVIHYTFSMKQNTVKFLIRNVSDASIQNIQLFNHEEIDMDMEKSKNQCTNADYDFKKQKNIENVINQIPERVESAQASEPAIKENSANFVIESVFENVKKKEPMQYSKRASTPIKTKLNPPLLATKKKTKQKIKLEDVQIQGIPKKGNEFDPLSTSTGDLEENLKSQGSGAEPKNEKLKAIVQLKYDGDRIQIHVERNAPVQLDEYNKRNIVKFTDSDEVVEVRSSALQKNGEMFKTKVQLFTKWGKNVTELYSSIQHALESNKELSMYAPCVFDAELILVHENNEPLPWYSEKWRYNSNSVPSESMSNILGVAQKVMGDSIIVFNHENPLDTGNGEAEEMGISTLNNEADNEEGTETLLFGTAQGLKKWSGVGTNDLFFLRGREVKDSTVHIQCVIFDILMHEEREVHPLCYKDRLQILEGVYKQRVFKERGTAFQPIRIIADSVLVNKVHELQTILKHVVEKRWEGLVIKDPRSSYVFGKTSVIQKLKINGPDVNTVVIGCGFSFSKNPRQWGFLTGISTGNNTFASYCRVEYLEGESPWKTFLKVLNLKSTIQTSGILKRVVHNMNGTKINRKKNSQAQSSIMLSDEGFSIELEHCIVYVQGYKSDNGAQYFKVEWNYHSDINKKMDYVLFVSKQHLIDIQWLSNPMECMFQLSVRGDLDPLLQNHCTLSSKEKKKTHVELFVPRNPVGRIEWKDIHHSDCDNSASITLKYDSHRSWDLLLQKNLVQNITKLRKISHHSDHHLQLARKIMLGYETYIQGKKNTIESQQEWPQVPPRVHFSVQDYDQLIKNVNNTLHQSIAQLPLLTKEEKLILLKIPPSKQTADKQQEEPKEITTSSEEGCFERELKKTQMQMLTKRLHALQKQFIENEEKMVIHTREKFSGEEQYAGHQDCVQCVVSPYFISSKEVSSEEDESEVEANEETTWEYLPVEMEIKLSVQSYRDEEEATPHDK